METSSLRCGIPIYRPGFQYSQETHLCWETPHSWKHPTNICQRPRNLLFQMQIIAAFGSKIGGLCFSALNLAVVVPTARSRNLQ